MIWYFGQKNALQKPSMTPTAWGIQQDGTRGDFPAQSPTLVNHPKAELQGIHLSILNQIPEAKRLLLKYTRFLSLQDIE